MVVGFPFGYGWDGFFDESTVGVCCRIFLVLVAGGVGTAQTDFLQFMLVVGFFFFVISRWGE